MELLMLKLYVTKSKLNLNYGYSSPRHGILNLPDKFLPSSKEK